MSTTHSMHWSDEEKKALVALAELYSGFYVEKDVASQLAKLSIPVERIEEILRERLHPALYTQLVWNGTGFETQKALPLSEIEAKLEACDPSQMNFITRTASNKFWDWGIKASWENIKEKVVQLRRSESGLA